MSNLIVSEIWRDDENGQTITITCDSFSALAEIACMGKQRKEITLEVSQRARSKNDGRFALDKLADGLRLSGPWVRHSLPKRLEVRGPWWVLQVSGG